MTAENDGMKATFVDVTGLDAPGLTDLWPSLVIPQEDIDAEITRLAGLKRPADGRRRALIVQPLSQGPGPGLARGMQVRLEVLRPGERTSPIRHNSSQVVFCIQGSGCVVINGGSRRVETHDVWNTPSMAPYVHVNDSREGQVRLVDSNAPLPEKVNNHHLDDSPREALPQSPRRDD